MNPFIAVFFQIIPLAMGAFTLALGVLVLAEGGGASAFVAGHVLVFLTAICVALYCTAATIIRLLTRTSSHFWRVAMPVLGFAVGLGSAIFGLWMAAGATLPEEVVAGHVVYGLGLISCCVATVATASVRFTLIPANSAGPAGTVPAQAFSAAVGWLLLAIPVVCTAAALGVAADVYDGGHTAPRFTAGCVLGGIGLICASLIALVASVVRQIRNTYGEHDRRFWPWFVIVAGGVNIIAGLLVLLAGSGAERLAPGFVLIGLGIVCYSILSKVLLLAVVWRHSYPLAGRIPLIPVCTGLVCLFLSAFLFQMTPGQAGLFVPSRVLAGLGAVCFTLFSIVSILESGTSGNKG